MIYLLSAKKKWFTTSSLCLKSGFKIYKEVLRIWISQRRKEEGELTLALREWKLGFGWESRWNLGASVGRAWDDLGVGETMGFAQAKLTTLAMGGRATKWIVVWCGVVWCERR